MYLAKEIVIAEGSLERKERERGRGINEVKTERERECERVRERGLSSVRDALETEGGKVPDQQTDGLINNPLNEQIAYVLSCYPSNLTICQIECRVSGNGTFSRRASERRGVRKRRNSR